MPPLRVVDTRSNVNDNIVNIANAIGRSAKKKQLVAAVYTGKRKIKTVADLMAATKLSQVRVLQLGGQLDGDAFHKVKKDGLTAYEKDPFVEKHKGKILSIAGKPKKIARIPTKTSLKIAMTTAPRVATPPRKHVRTITVDDVDTFAKVRKIAHGLSSVAMPEAQFKKGMETIIGEPFGQPDWGGEKGDLSTTRLRLKGTRIAATFAFKGPGTTGLLTPAKMGKRGDQIANMFEADAQVYFVQYWDAIDPALRAHMQKFALYHAGARGTTIWYGVIDGDDSARLIRAYPKAFGSLRRTTPAAPPRHAARPRGRARRPSRTPARQTLSRRSRR